MHTCDQILEKLWVDLKPRNPKHRSNQTPPNARVNHANRRSYRVVAPLQAFTRTWVFVAKCSAGLTALISWIPNRFGVPELLGLGRTNPTTAVELRLLTDKEPILS